MLTTAAPGSAPRRAAPLAVGCCCGVLGSHMAPSGCGCPPLLRESGAEPGPIYSRQCTQRGSTCVCHRRATAGTAGRGQTVWGPGEPCRAVPCLPCRAILCRAVPRHRRTRCHPCARSSALIPLWAWRAGVTLSAGTPWAHPFGVRGDPARCSPPIPVSRVSTEWGGGAEHRAAGSPGALRALWWQLNASPGPGSADSRHRAADGEGGRGHVGCPAPRPHRALCFPGGGRGRFEGSALPTLPTCAGGTPGALPALGRSRRMLAARWHCRRRDTARLSSTCGRVPAFGIPHGWSVFGVLSGTALGSRPLCTYTPPQPHSHVHR